MMAEPVEAAEAPLASDSRRDGETGDSSRSISELISFLRTAFRSSDFDRVEEILIAREEKMRRELEKKEEECELTRESLRIERLENAEAEVEFGNFKAKCAELDAMRERAEERAKRSEEMYENLLRKVKTAEKEKSFDLAELQKKNGELESAKTKAKEELELWKRKFGVLDGGMTPTVITIEYGEWKDEGSYIWCKGDNTPISVVIDTEITFVDLVEKLHLKLKVDRNKTDMKLSYMSTSRDTSGPVYLIEDECVFAFLMDRDENSRRGILRVELVKQDKSDEGVQECANVLGINDLKEGLHLEIDDSDHDEDGDKGYANADQGEPFHDPFLYYTPMERNVSDVAPAFGIDGMIPTGAKGPSVVPNNLGTSPSTLSPEVELCVDDNREPLNVEAPVPHSLTDGSNFEIGQNFVSKDELKNKLHEVAMNNCFEMKIRKSTKTLYVVRCVDEHCNWKLRAAKVPNSNFFSIRTYCNTHTCNLEKGKKKRRQASAAVVADMVRNNFNDIKETPTPKAIMEMMNNIGVEVTYWKAWMGIKIANNLRRGSPEQSFELLPSYLYMARKVNPGTVTHLEVDESNRFKYLFLAFGATIRGFSCMRKVISIDGMWLKSKYKGFLLLATAQDGDCHCYPIAWAVVDSENDAAWTWFFTKLKEIIPDNNELVFISDMHPSIKDPMANVYQNAHHGHCMRHIQQNIERNFHCVDAVNLFKWAAQAYQVSQFTKWWNEIQSRYPSVATHLSKITTFGHWSRAYFDVDRYNIMTTDAAELIINNVLMEAREYPLIAMLDVIQEMMSDWFHRYRKEAASCKNPLTPTTEATLQERYTQAQKMKATPLNEFEYDVKGGALDAIVDLGQWRCSCRVFDLDRLPCAHALAAMEQGKAYDFCSDYYRTETWALAYSETIYPVPPSSEWDIAEGTELIKVLPPTINNELGRIKMKRIPSVGEGRRRNRRVPRVDMKDIAKIIAPSQHHLKRARSNPKSKEMMHLFIRDKL